MISRDLIELVAVQHEVAAPVGRLVNEVVLDPDVAEGGSDVLARNLVVVPRHEDHSHLMPRALEDLLQHGVLGRRPVDPAALHRPEVDDVAHEEQVLRVVRLQKLEQTLGLAGARAQVDVGEEDRPDLVGHRFPSARLHAPPVSDEISRSTIWLRTVCGQRDATVKATAAVAACKETVISSRYAARPWARTGPSVGGPCISCTSRTSISRASTGSRLPFRRSAASLAGSATRRRS